MTKVVSSAEDEEEDEGLKTKSEESVKTDGDANKAEAEDLLEQETVQREESAKTDGDANKAEAEDPLEQETVQRNKKMFEAAAKGDLATLRQFHKEGASLDVVNEDGNPLLHFPVRLDHVAMVAFMLEKEVDVNAVNKNGTDALQLAAYAGNNEVLEMLLYAGSYFHHQDTSGNTALHFTCQFNHLISSMQLINSGSRLDIVNGIGDIPLHGACRNSMLDVVASMCSLGCPLNVANNQQETPIHIASKCGSSEVVRLLMLYGAKIDLLNKNSKTPEEVATNPDVKKLFAMYKQGVQGSSENKNYELRKNLSPSHEPLNQLKIVFLGNSGVGKTSLINSLKCGFLKSFLWSNYYTLSKPNKASKSAASKLGDMMGRMYLGNGAVQEHNYSRGISIQKTNISEVGNVVLMDFSGVESYFNSYSLFLGDSSCAHVIVVSLDDPPHQRHAQIDFWLEFIRIRVSPKEPIGLAGCNMWAPNVYVVATNAREDNCQIDEKGQWLAGVEWSFMNKLLEKYEREMILNQPLILLDAHMPKSAEMTSFKKMLALQKEMIENFLPTRLGCLEDTLYEFPAFANSKAAFPVVWFQEFASWVREKVNLLAMDKNVRDLLVQLQLMGEVACFGTEPSELVVLKPNWLACDIIGSLYSREALQSCSKWSGFVDQAFLQALTPKVEFKKLVDLLKSLGLTFERSVNNTCEYYMHPYNKMDFKANSDEVLKASVHSALKAIVHIETPFPTVGQLSYLFHSVITAINMSFKSETTHFNQWKNACRVQYSGNTGIVELEDCSDSTGLVIKCYSDNSDPNNLFTFCESLCAVVFGAIDAVSPGFFFQRLPTSWVETQRSINSSICLKSEDILMSALKFTETSDKTIKVGDREEKLSDVLTFGSEEFFEKITLGSDAHINCLSHFARSMIAWHVDKEFGKCVKLAKELKVEDKKLPVVDGSVSALDSLITYLNADPDMTIRRFAMALEKVYGEDLLKLLFKLTPVFVYTPVIQPILDERQVEQK